MKTLKDQQAFIGKLLGRCKAYVARGQVSATLEVDQNTVDLLDAIYGNLKYFEVETDPDEAEKQHRQRSNANRP